MTSRLDKYLKTAVNDLPAMPLVANEVVKAVEDPMSSIDDMRKLIERDAGIATRILKVSNSALYGFPSEIQTLSHAIALLGTQTVRNLVLAVSMKQTYKQFGLMEKLLWQHSALAGPVAQQLAKYPGIGIDPEEAFIAGLLHDIGKTALANSHRDEYEQVISRVYNEGISSVEAEMDQFEFDHAEIGAAITERWKLPDSLVSVIRHHHDPGSFAALPGAEGRLTALISLTTACLTRLGIGRRDEVPELDLGTLPAWAFLDLQETDVEPILSLVTDVVKRSQVMVGV